MIENINGYNLIKDLPTTEVVIQWVSYENNNNAVGVFRRAIFSSFTGAQVDTEETPIDTQDVVRHRAWLVSERQRILDRIADFDAFTAEAQTKIAQWLIDNPNPAEP